MAFTANTMFEVKNSNSRYNQTQNIPGKFGTNTGASFSGADCSAGLLCIKNGNLPLAGYESLVDGNSNPRFYNSNSFYFNVAANGNSGGMYGDHTGIYFCNSYDVNKAQSLGNSENLWNLGMDSLGLGVPAGVIGDFTECIIGEQYAVGAGNFSTLPSDSTYIYATISNGYLVAATSAPAAGSGVYFEIAPVTTPITEGASYAGERYLITAKRTLEVASE